MRVDRVRVANLLLLLHDLLRVAPEKPISNTVENGGKSMVGWGGRTVGSGLENIEIYRGSNVPFLTGSYTGCFIDKKQR